MDVKNSDRVKVYNYLIKHNKPYLCMVYLAFHSLLRPKEITFLKPENFNFKKRIIFIDGKIAKNHNDRIAPISNDMFDLLKSITEKAKNSDYVFSTNFEPGKKLVSRREISRYWNDLRETLKLPKEFQFYSLRDSGIIQKLKDGIDPKSVMELADHSSLEVTNKYVKIAKVEFNYDSLDKMSKF